MKKNDLTDLKTKTIDELKRRLLDLRGEVDKAKEVSMNKISREAGSRSAGKNTNFFRSKKKEIAQVLTFLSMKDIVIAEKEKGGQE